MLIHLSNVSSVCCSVYRLSENGARTSVTKRHSVHCHRETQKTMKDITMTLHLLPTMTKRSCKSSHLLSLRETMNRLSQYCWRPIFFFYLTMKYTSDTSWVLLEGAVCAGNMNTIFICLYKSICAWNMTQNQRFSDSHCLSRWYKPAGHL